MWRWTWPTRATASSRRSETYADFTRITSISLYFACIGCLVLCVVSLFDVDLLNFCFCSVLSGFSFSHSFIFILCLGILFHVPHPLCIGLHPITQLMTSPPIRAAFIAGVAHHLPPLLHMLHRLVESSSAGGSQSSSSSSSSVSLSSSSSVSSSLTVEFQCDDDSATEDARALLSSMGAAANKSAANANANTNANSSSKVKASSVNVTNSGTSDQQQQLQRPRLTVRMRQSAPGADSMQRLLALLLNLSIEGAAVCVSLFLRLCAEKVRERERE